MAVIAGTGGGKTFLGPWWLAEQIKEYPSERWMVISPTYKMLQRTTMKELVDDYRGTCLEGEYKEQKGQYLLPDGGIIYAGSADRPETLEGVQVRGVWGDEAGQYKRLVWTIIQARIGQKMGKALLTTTPYALNWLYSEFYQRWRDGDPDYDVIQFVSIDNPHYPKEEFARAKRTFNEQLFAMRYLGEFRRMEGLVYSDWKAENIIEPFEIPKDWRLIGGIDFGFHNPFVSLDIAIDSDGVHYVCSEHYRSGMLLKDHGKNLDGRITYSADPSAKQEIEELKGLGMAIEPANNEVEMGIQKVTELIRDRRLKVFKTCQNLIDEFETYHRDEKGKIIKENDHALDALRYAVLTKEPAIFQDVFIL